MRIGKMQARDLGIFKIADANAKYSEAGSKIAANYPDLAGCTARDRQNYEFYTKTNLHF